MTPEEIERARRRARQTDCRPRFLRVEPPLPAPAPPPPIPPALRQALIEDWGALVAEEYLRRKKSLTASPHTGIPSEAAREGRDDG